MNDAQLHTPKEAKPSSSQLRWSRNNVIGNIAGSIGGILFGAACYYAFYLLFCFLNPIQYCSGTPCGNAWLYNYIISASIAGMLGGGLGYIIYQKINHHKIRFKSAMYNGFLGVLIWPVVEGTALFVGILFIILTAPLEPIKESIGYAFFVIIGGIIVVIIPGILLGLVLTLCRKLDIG